jgi:bifunctional ADP-heptose synthase (sugar kinase/adenylyltransferase)
VRILVIGERCIDRHIYTKTDRLCPEAPCPVLTPKITTESFGMAANVAANIRSLGADCDLVCNDTEIRKTRFVDDTSNQMFIRYDENDIAENIGDRLEDVDFDIYDAVVISDYDKGFLSKKDIQEISWLHDLVFLDTKKILDFEMVRGIKFVKLNLYEVEQSKKANANIVDEIWDKLITTLGSSGCAYRDNVYPVEKVEIKDFSGAGDTFLAAFVVKYIETSDVEKALTFANECATIVVQKRGVVSL